MEKQVYQAIVRQLNFRPNPRALAIHVLQDLGIGLAAFAAVASRSPVGWVLAQPLLACVFFRSFSLMHDAVHRCVSRRPLVNDWLGVFYGGLCFLPFTTWRSMHMDHHTWVGNFNRDPVMKMVREFPEKSPVRQKLDTILWRSWIPYIAFLQEAVFWTVSAAFLFQEGKYKGRRLELGASLLTPLLALAALVAAGQWAGHWALFLPSLVIYLGMVEIINLPHHLRTPRLPGEGKLNLWNQYKVSRTCVYSRWFSRFILLNFNYHAEHHMFPSLPWHQLDRAFALVSLNRPSDYQICEGHQWIRENRQRNLGEVFAPTQSVRPDTHREPEAA